MNVRLLLSVIVVALAAGSACSNAVASPGNKSVPVITGGNGSGIYCPSGYFVAAHCAADATGHITCLTMLPYMVTDMCAGH